MTHYTRHAIPSHTTHVTSNYWHPTWTIWTQSASHRSAAQHNALQRSPPQCNTAHRIASQCSASQRNTAQHSAKQRIAAHPSATQRNATQRSAAQRSATQHNTMRRDVTQHNAPSGKSRRGDSSEEGGEARRKLSGSWRRHLFRSEYFRPNHFGCSHLHSLGRDPLHSHFRCDPFRRHFRRHVIRDSFDVT